MSAISHVLVLYRPSAQGDRALAQACEFARAEGARMTVITAALLERCDPRCCSIRSSYWNEVLRQVAEHDMRRATETLAGAPGVDFAVASGESLATVLAREAAERGCDVIVVPRPTHRRLLAHGSKRLARKLSRASGGDVIELAAPTSSDEVDLYGLRLGLASALEEPLQAP